MKRTRIITLLVVLALALAVVAPASAATEPARLPWRDLAEFYAWFFGLPAWGFWTCGGEGTAFEGDNWQWAFWSYDWREWPDWLKDEAIDWFNANNPYGDTFGHCRDVPGAGQSGCCDVVPPYVPPFYP